MQTTCRNLVTNLSRSGLEWTCAWHIESTRCSSGAATSGSNEEINDERIPKSMRDWMNRKHLSKKEALAGTKTTDSRRHLVELLRKHNFSLPKLTGQHVEATILRVQSKTLLVDTGYYGVSEVDRSDVNLAHLLAPPGSDKGAIIKSRATISDLRPGDKVAVKIQAVFTPFGDMQLTGPGTVSEVTVSQNLMWRELEACMSQRRPVEGRVLNACPGGYAVGVGGIVGLLPYGSYKKSPHMVKAVGVLQPFLVTKVNEERRELRLAAY